MALTTAQIIVILAGANNSNRRKPRPRKGGNK